MMRHNRVNHFAVAAACRANPGEWQPVGEYASSRSADGVSHYIRKASAKTHRSAYSPPGSFETRRELTEFGTQVEARYVGISNDAAWAEALTSITEGGAS